MFHHRHLPIAHLSLSTFFAEHRDALLNAASLLGGPQAARRVAALAQAISSPIPPAQRTWRDLDWFASLLALDHVEDPDSVEAVCFAQIDPADPVVADICLLTDQYSDHLTALREERRAARRPVHSAA